MDVQHLASEQHKKALANHYPDTFSSKDCPGPTATSRQQQERSPDSLLKDTDMQEEEQNQPQLPPTSVDTEPAVTHTDPPVYREWTPIPLLSQTVDKLQHDAFCGLLQLQSNEIAKKLSQSLDLKGTPFMEWWSQMAPTCTTVLWHAKLWAFGTPKQQVRNADEEYIGTILFYHIDFDGHYHEDPLQTSPPTD